MKTNFIRVLALAVLMCLFATTCALASDSVIQEGGTIVGPQQTPSPEQQALDSYFESMYEQFGNFEQWTYQQKAEFSSKEAELGFVKSIVYGLPKDSDISEQKAIEIAREAIVEKYELTDATLERFSIGTSFILTDPRNWRVEFYPKNTSDFQEIGTYFVSILPEGEVWEILSAADSKG